MAKTDTVLDSLPVGTTITKTETGYDVKRPAGNGFQQGAGATLALAVADIGAVHEDAKD